MQIPGNDALQVAQHRVKRLLVGIVVTNASRSLEIDKLPGGIYRATVGTLFEHQEICRTRIVRGFRLRGSGSRRRAGGGDPATASPCHTARSAERCGSTAMAPAPAAADFEETARASISSRTSSGVEGADSASNTSLFKTEVTSVLPPYRSAAFIHRWADRGGRGGQRVKRRRADVCKFYKPSRAHGAAATLVQLAARTRN